MLTRFCVAFSLGLSLLGCAPENPPVTRELVFDKDETRALAVRACFDCHSNDTVWPWYTQVPFVSGVIAGDVERGRAYLNFSEWDRPQSAGEIAPAITEGTMPLSIYLPMHPEADLTDAEKDELKNGLQASIAADPPPGG